MTATFDDSGNTYLNNTIVRKNSLYKRISAVALKNGRVLIAGITHEVGEGHIEITMYDPKTEKSPCYHKWSLYIQAPDLKKAASNPYHNRLWSDAYFFHHPICYPVYARNRRKFRKGAESPGNARVSGSPQR